MSADKWISPGQPPLDSGPVFFKACATCAAWVPYPMQGVHEYWHKATNTQLLTLEKRDDD